MARPRGLWFPRLLGMLAAILAAVYAGSCVVEAPSEASQVVLGHRLQGDIAWLASIAHALFFTWLAWACFRRRAAAVWGVIGYSLYLIENIWVYTTGEGLQIFASAQSLIIVNALLTALLLVLCRVVLQRRNVFDT